MGQSLVIDSNMMQSSDLRVWLAADPAHRAILTDFVWIEIYKQASVDALEAALSVIGDFPGQIALLKNGLDLARLDPSLPDLPGRMLQPPAPRDIRAMRDVVALARQGDPDVLAQLQARWTQAGDQIDGMLAGAGDIVESLPEIAAVFSKAEHRILRTGQPLTRNMLELIFGCAEQISETLHASYGVQDPRPQHLHDAWLYRYSAGLVVMTLWWIRTGSQIPRRLDRFRNDLIDLGIGVSATYFDGFMSVDARARWMHGNLIGALNTIRETTGATGSSDGPV